MLRLRDINLQIRTDCTRDVITAQQTSRRFSERLSTTVSFSKHSMHSPPVFPQHSAEPSLLQFRQYNCHSSETSSVKFQIWSQIRQFGGHQHFWLIRSFIFPFNVPFHASHNAHFAFSQHNVNRLATDHNIPVPRVLVAKFSVVNGAMIR